MKYMNMRNQYLKGLTQVISLVEVDRLPKKIKLKIGIRF